MRKVARGAMVHLMQTVGERIAWARKRRGLSCLALDRAAGITDGHTAKMEREGGGEPRLGTARKLAAVLGVEASWLLFGGPRPQIARAT